MASVPDPTGSLGFRFDETIDSIEAAARSYGYVLERWRLPWSEQAEEAGPKLADEKESPPPEGEATGPAKSGSPLKPRG